MPLLDFRGAFDSKFEGHFVPYSSGNITYDILDVLLIQNPLLHEVTTLESGDRYPWAIFMVRASPRRVITVQ